jgi:hypothetical protein
MEESDIGKFPGFGACCDAVLSEVRVLAIAFARIHPYLLPRTGILTTLEKIVGEAVNQPSSH